MFSLEVLNQVLILKIKWEESGIHVILKQRQHYTNKKWIPSDYVTYKLIYTDFKLNHCKYLSAILHWCTYSPIIVYDPNYMYLHNIILID